MKRADKKHLFLGIAFLVLFVIVVILMKNGIFNAIDFIVDNYFRNVQTNFGFVFMKIVSFFASTTFVIIFSILFVLFLFSKKKHREWLFYLSILVFGVFSSFVVKNIIKRMRPENLLETDYSFPSDHVVASVLICFSLSYFLWNRNRKLAITLLFVPLLTGLSRLYLNVHWFSDILGGLLLGIGVFFLGIYIFYRNLKNKN